MVNLGKNRLQYIITESEFLLGLDILLQLFYNNVEYIVHFFSLLGVVPQAPLPQKPETVSKMEEPVSGQENPTKYRQ